MEPALAEDVPRQRRGSVGKLATSGYVTTAFGLVTGPITARVLGPSGRGEVAAAVVYSTYLAMILSFGLPNAVGFWLASGRSAAASLLASVLRYAGLLIVPALILGSFAGIALTSFSPSGRLGVAVLVALSPVGVVTLCMESMIRARGELGLLTVTRYLALGAPALSVVILWGAGVLSVLTVLVTSVVTTGLVAAYMYAGLAARPAAPTRLGPLLRYGSQSALGSMATAVSGRLDQALIAPILGPEALGLYAVAVTVSSLPVALAWAFGTRAFREVGAADPADQLDIAARYVRMTVLLSLPFTLGVGLAAPVFMPVVYGVAFKAAVAPTLLLLPATVALCFLAPAELCMSALGRPGRVSTAEGVGTLVGLVALLALLRPYGIVGAALATDLDMGVSAGLLVWSYKRLGPCPFLPRGSDVSGLWCRLSTSKRRLLPLLHARAG